MSKFRKGDRVRLSALGKQTLRRDWHGEVIETDCSRYGDIVRVQRDRGGKSGLMWAEYWELDALDNMVGYAGSSSSISVSDLENV